MKRISIMGFGLAAALAPLAIAASGALAAPPTAFECAKGSGYEKGCETANPDGKYNVSVTGPPGKAFAGKGGSAILHIVIPTLGSLDETVGCASFKDEGKMFGHFASSVHIAFRKCKSSGRPCKSEGAKAGEIRTEPLSGELGWMAPAVAGLSLANEAAPGSGYLTQFECEGLGKVRLLGSAIGQLSPINVFTKEETVTFGVGKYLGATEYEPGRTYEPLTNVPKFEEGSLDVLGTEFNAPETGFTWQPPGGLPSGLEATAVNKGKDLKIAEGP